MQYHIQTAPIYESFSNDCDCPLCELYARVSNRLVGQYLNEAVMEPDFRVRVNKLGFCDYHVLELFKGKNKLGLALQLNTRTQHVIEKLSLPKNAKGAINEAKKIEKSLSTCVICDAVNEMMTRYAYTIAQMFVYENGFKQTMQKSNGFCMPHYALLLRESAKAGKLQEDYLKTLYDIQTSSMHKINSATDRFTTKYDYRNNGSGATPDNSTIPNAIKKLRGRIL